MNEIMIAIISSIISAIVTAIVTVPTTLYVERRKEKREDKKEEKEIFSNRPELEIVEYKDYLSHVGYGVKQKCDIEVFVAGIKNVAINGSGKYRVVCPHYRKEDFNSNDWCAVIYTFRNSGKTDISSLNVICNYKRDTCIFPCNSAERWASENVLNYSYCYDKKIRVGETITVKFCYHKDHILCGTFSANMSIGMEDDYKRHWVQPLFAPQDKIYNSEKTTYKNYMQEIRTDMAEKCFKNPCLW